MPVDASIVAALNTLITSFFAKKLQLDNVSFTALSTVSSYLLSKLINNDYSEQFTYLNKINTTTIITVTVVFLLCFTFVFYKKIKYFINKTTFKQHHKLTLESDSAIKIFSAYTAKYSDMFDLPSSFVVTQGNSNRPAENVVVRFNDTNLNLSGYYTVDLSDVLNFQKQDGENHGNKINEKKYVFYVYIQKHETITTINYIDVISKYVCDPVEIYSVKTYEYTVLSQRYVSKPYYKIYSGQPMSIKTIDDLYIKPLFHPQKNNLWKQIQHINNKKNTMSMQLGLILHGPPGTGKSRFAYCMAMATGRHLISIDMLSFRKHRLHSLLKSPEVDGRPCTPADVIYVLDEFDITVMTLHEKELNDQRIAKSNQKKLEDYEAKLQKYNENLDKLNENGNPLVAEPVVPNTIYSIDRGSSDVSQLLTVSSLLELLNGPVPLKGAIFIATTNSFDAIQKICPALFRTGRLNPIFFGYAETPILQEISEHYYKKQLNIDDGMIATIPTSDIINYITCHQLDQTYEFDKFEQYIFANTKIK